MRLSEELRHQARALIADRMGLDLPATRQADLDRGLAEALRHASAGSGS